MNNTHLNSFWSQVQQVQALQQQLQQFTSAASQPSRTSVYLVQPPMSHLRAPSATLVPTQAPAFTPPSFPHIPISLLFGSQPSLTTTSSPLITHTSTTRFSPFSEEQVSDLHRNSPRNTQPPVVYIPDDDEDDDENDSDGDPESFLRLSQSDEDIANSILGSATPTLSTSSPSYIRMPMTSTNSNLFVTPRSTDSTAQHPRKRRRLDSERETTASSVQPSPPCACHVQITAQEEEIKKLKQEIEDNKKVIARFNGEISNATYEELQDLNEKVLSTHQKCLKEMKSRVEEEKAERDGMQCLICAQNRRCMLYTPCYHMAQCDKCPVQDKCILCRKVVVKNVKVFT